jgi:hypothetical protein
VTEPIDPEVPERARRRTYSAQYKLRILAEYEGCDPGAKGALLRREGLYSSMISEWRKQRDHGALQGLATPAGRPRHHSDSSGAIQSPVPVPDSAHPEWRASRPMLMSCTNGRIEIPLQVVSTAGWSAERRF